MRKAPSIATRAIRERCESCIALVYDGGVSAYEFFGQFRSPSKPKLAGSSRFVQTPDRGGGRSRVQKLRICFRFFADLKKGLSQGVKGLL